MKRDREALDAMADVVLAYRPPKRLSAAAKKRKKKAKASRKKRI